MKIPVTDIDWSDGLPCLSRAEYSLQPLSTFERTDLASGRSQMRRLFSFVPVEVNIRMLADDGEAFAFEQFFRDVLNDGVKWFNIELKTPRAEYDGMVCRFKDMYSGPRLHENGNKWIYSFTLLTFERPLWPAPWGGLPDWVANASRFDVLMNWVWPKWDVMDYELRDSLIAVYGSGAQKFSVLAPSMYEAIQVKSVESIRVEDRLGEWILEESGSDNLCIQSNPGPLWVIQSGVVWSTEDSEIGLGKFFKTTDLQNSPAATNRITVANSSFEPGTYTQSFFIEINPQDTGRFLVYVPGSAFNGTSSFRIDTANKTVSAAINGVLSVSIKHVSGNTYRVSAVCLAMAPSTDFALRIRPDGTNKSGEIKIGCVQINRGDTANYPIETNGSAISYGSDYLIDGGKIQITPKLQHGAKIYFSGIAEGYTI